jgi:D-glycero-D-manno-heptose 1,7-bisphosphate phosphatase
MTRPTQAVILCGGLGSRLRPFTDTMPKPMVPCNGKPFLWHLLQQLHEQGIDRFVLLTGYLAKKIESYFGDGKSWGWEILYSEGPVEWDTGKRIWEARKNMDDRFLLLYSDNFVPFPLDRVLMFHEQNQKPLTFMVAPKLPGNIALDESGIVERYDNSRSNDKLNYVEIGYMVVERDITLSFYERPECSFSSVIKKMAAHHQIGGWIQQDTYHSISDPERWERVKEYLKPKKIILIDRDGVINEKAPRGQYISRWEDFKWISQTYEAMVLLAQEGFKFIIISNQAGIARRMIDPNELERIHFNMTEKFLESGIEILNTYVCPHHWDENCYCRKPKPGMFNQASEEWLLRLDKTLYIGDDPRDCQAAYSANCKAVAIGHPSEFKDLSDKEAPMHMCDNLTEAVPAILKYFKN